MTDTWRVRRRAAPALGLVGLVAGVPALLVGVVGWPLPHGLPSADAVRSALSDGWQPDARFVLGVLAVVLWVLWAQLMRHVVFQVRVQLQTRRAGGFNTDDVSPLAASTSDRRRGLGPLVARWLVTGIMAVGPLLPHPATAAPAPRIPVVLMATNAMAASIPGGDRPAAPPTPATDATTGPAYVVHTWAERRDCLWNIAERYLGDPFRWTEIRDLNRDRIQPDGRRLGDEPSNWVYPGWELVLPADASGPELVGPDDSGVARRTETPTPAPPESSPGAAEPASVPTTAIVAPKSTSITTSTAPAGAVAPVPAATSPSPSTNSGKSPSSPTVPEPNRGRVEKPRMGAAASRAIRYAALGLPVLAAGGLLLRLKRLRLAQVAACRPGRQMVEPDPELEPLELQIRAVAAEDAAEWVDATLRALSAALADAPAARLPEIVCVRVGELGVEVLLATAHTEAPAGFEVADTGFVWRLDPTVDLDELRARGPDHGAACPALVSLGASPEGPVAVDLEALGALSVEGHPERVSAFLAGVALELASATWARNVELRVLGASPALAHVDGVVASDDADEVLRELNATVAATRDGLADVPTPFAARMDGGSGEDWPPSVVVVAGPVADADAVEAMAQLAADPGSGVVVIAPGPLVGARWRLFVAGDGTATLEPLGLSVLVAGVEAPLEVTQTLDEGAIEGATSLLASASDTADVAPVVELDPGATARRALPRRDRFELWVSILGPHPEVSGWTTDIGQRKKLAELVVYLAVHDERPVPCERLRLACWPDREVSYDTFKETVSRVRKHLGNHGDGRRHLPPAASNAYRLGPSVGSDWSCFKALVAAAARAPAREAMRLYREALEMVQGEPFAEVVKGTYVWAESEMLVHTIPLAVSDAAASLGELALANGNPELAHWASVQGLLVSPCQQSLFRVDMRAAAERGDAEGIDRALRAATRAHQSVDPETEVPAETLELYRQLTGQHRARREA